MDGTFGKIVLKGSVITKNTKTNDYGSIAELIFMISYNNTIYFPSLYNFSINSHDIFISMEYCGLTLSNLAYKIDYSCRLKLIPEFIRQINDILFFLKSIRVAHMDIKPSNICYNTTRKSIKLIDFGFVTKICGKYTTKMCGTYNFADPDHIRNKLPANYEYDTFGAGLSLYSFLNKSHISFIKTIGINYDVLLKEVGHVEHEKYLPKDTAEYLKSMIQLDRKLRPIPSSERLCDLGGGGHNVPHDPLAEEHSVGGHAVPHDPLAKEFSDSGGHAVPHDPLAEEFSDSGGHTIYKDTNDQQNQQRTAIRQLLYKSYNNEDMITYALNLYNKITCEDRVKSLGNENIILEYCTSLSLHIYEKTDIYLIKKPSKLFEFIKILLSIEDFRKNIYP